MRPPGKARAKVIGQGFEGTLRMRELCTVGCGVVLFTSFVCFVRERQRNVIQSNTWHRPALQGLVHICHES